MKTIITLTFALFSVFTMSQVSKLKSESFFGFNYKPLIPFGVVGDAPVDLQNGNLRTTVSSAFGYSFGAVVRSRVTDLIALETGLLYTTRNYKADISLSDSNLYVNGDFGIVNFDLPVNALVFIQLGRNLYANAMLGGSLNFNPSDVRDSINVGNTPHQFVFAGSRYTKDQSKNGYLSFAINAAVGFELRTRKEGTFYMGVASKIPVSPTLEVGSAYRQTEQGYVIGNQGILTGATFSLDFKYFFHNVENKGWQYNRGPIEQ
ncbi:outer membrane beta-barrel protein [Lishizhenia sp.]|uniref:outer membrane beta-barrel protein n=1 Tax=Lishizhenia sp. TaxID=2497594 RepID=UPI00299E53D8|nr:outer membrane beta-barrel protein [Lishizhenia sp.]MDX1444681.1 outer membrane beta-barrel protein [Lishizhenia sp.]